MDDLKRAWKSPELYRGLILPALS